MAETGKAEGGKSWYSQTENCIPVRRHGTDRGLGMDMDSIPGMEWHRSSLISHVEAQLQQQASFLTSLLAAELTMVWGPVWEDRLQDLTPSP